MIKWKHKKKILAGLKRDRLSGAFDRLSCSKKGKRRMEKLIYKTKYENQFTNQNIARIAKVALNKLPRESSLNVSFVCPVCAVCPFCLVCPDCLVCPVCPVCPLCPLCPPCPVCDISLQR